MGGQTAVFAHEECLAVGELGFGQLWKPAEDAARPPNVVTSLQGPASLARAVQLWRNMQRRGAG